MRLTIKTFFGELYQWRHPSPVGELSLFSSPKGLRGILFDKDLQSNSCGDILRCIPTKESEHIITACEQLDQYFEKKRKSFQVMLDPFGTDFQKKAWQELAKIPYGKTISYQQQAKGLGCSNLARAVGGANRKNPLSIIVPCHRVIGKDGNLTGFAGGLDLKSFLLDHESDDLCV